MFNEQRGFGFITAEDGKDVYVHISEIEGNTPLEVGEEVDFEIESGDRGPKAKNVKKI